MGILEGIEANHPRNIFSCCNELLEKWHDQDVDGSWEKMIAIIDSPAVAGLKTTNTTLAVLPQNISGQELITLE